MTHEVVLHGYNVKPGSLQLGTFDSYGIEKIHVTADDEWAGLDILAVFHAPDGTATKVVVGANGMLAVPPEATAKQAGNGRIVFVGLAENVQRITVDMGYNIKPHSDIDGDNPGTPTPDVVQQILENSNHAVSIATAAQEAAENARQAAEDAAKKAGEGAGGAAASAAAAKKSAEDAAASSESAAGKAEASESSANAANESAKAAQAAQGSAENAAQTAADAAGVAGKAAGVAAQSAKAAETAKQRAEDAAKKALEAKTGSENALQDADAAKDAASGYADAAAEKATAAADSEKNAAKSANSAADSAAAAKKSAEDADNTANSIKDSMTQISENKEAVSKLKEDLSGFKNNVDKNMSSFNKFDDFNESVGLARIDSGIAYIDSSFNRYKTITINAVSGQEFEFIGSVNGAINYLVITTDASGKVIEKYNRGVNGVVSQKTQVISVDDNIKKIYFCFWQDSGYSLRKKDLVNIKDLENQIKSYTDTKYTEAITYVDNVKEDTSALKKRQNVLVGSETGNPISCNDAYSAPLCGLTVYGKSTQDGTPTFDAPVPIVSAGDGGSVVVKVSDGNGKEQTLALPTPNGLPGIPVTSGGNYTDQNGQQWACDEVDLERGVKVQRVNIVDLSTCVITGTTNLAVTKRLAIRLPLKGKDYTVKAICNRLPYLVSFTSDTIHFYVDTNNVQVFIPIGAKNPEEGEYILFYVLAAPIETPLTPAEIAAYKALTAYAPDTVVQASDGAGVKLEYQRDVNLVVKNLEDTIASMTTT